MDAGPNVSHQLETSHLEFEGIDPPLKNPQQNPHR